MHGTFRGRIEDGTGTTVRFDMRPSHVPISHKWRAKMAALLAGCCVAAVPIAWPTAPSRDVERQPPSRDKRATAPALLAAAYPIRRIITPAPVVHARQASPSIPLPNAPPPSAIVPAEPAKAIEPPVPRDIPGLAVAPSPSPPDVVNLPDPATKLAVAQPLPAAMPAETVMDPPLVALRPVDVMQIADSEVRSLRVPQLREPGLAAGGEPALSTRIAAMQVTPLPPPRLRDSDRVVLLAEAPTRLTLRIGNSALGKVDFRMTDARTIDVKLSGLLDLLAGQYDAAEFARLRSSAAADAYVSFDQLRALGLNVRYDPAYDELRING
jgi:hypothetical protein